MTGRIAAIALLSLCFFAAMSAIAIEDKPVVATKTDKPAEQKSDKKADDKAKSVTNSLGMKLVRIPKGEFLMGRAESKDELAKAFPQYDRLTRIEKLDDETPQHKVRITKDYYLAAHELTVGQFKKFIGESGYKVESEADGTGAWGFNRGTGQPDPRNLKYSWKNPGFPQGDDHPVVNITINDAKKFCEWLSKKEGKRYRLPTEAEWEYACRAGGANQRYNFGDDPEGLAKNANSYDKTSADEQPEWKKYALAGDDKFPYTAPVGSYAPNAWGLHDMHGNVWEWCSDYYGEDYFAKSPTDDPKGPEKGGKHVRRGGAWASWALYTRSAFRNYNTPQSRYFNLGLRAVLEAE